MGRNDLTLDAAYNLQHICWTGGDTGAVKAIAEKYLVLEDVPRMIKRMVVRVDITACI